MGQPTIEPGQTDLASIRELAVFFGIGRAAIPGLMERMGVPKRGKGYPWLRVWVALGVNRETVRDPVALDVPLLDLKQVADMLGESPKTVRRRSDGTHADKSFPAHVDLGPRKRMFFGSEIHAWITGVPEPFERRRANLSFVLDKTPKSRAKAVGRPPEPPSTVPRNPAAAMFMKPPAPD